MTARRFNSGNLRCLRRNSLQILRLIPETFLPLKLKPFSLLNPLQFLTELAIGPDPITISNKSERNDRNTQTQERDQAARPVHTEPVEHRLCSKGDDGAEDTSRAASG